MNKSPIDRFLEAHKLSCATRRHNNNGAPCSCGRDESEAQLQALRDIKSMLTEALAKTEPWTAVDTDPLSPSRDTRCIHCGVVVDYLDRGWRETHPADIHHKHCLWLAALLESAGRNPIYSPSGTVLIPRPIPPPTDTTGGI